MTYITPPITGDPDERFQLFVDALRTRVAGYDPADGGLVTWLGEAAAQLVTDLAETGSETLTEDFRWFGEQLANVAYQAATYATGTVEINGTADQVVPAGTHMYALVGDTRVGFTTVDDATLTAGVATGVVVVADEAGAIGEGISGTLTLQDRYDFIASVELEAATTGGEDEEGADVYLDKLAERTRTFTDTPILPRDFAVMSKQVPGVWRAVAVDGFDATDNEKQTITVNATGGDFNITFDGQSVFNVVWNAAASTVKTALESLSNVNPGDVIVTGGPLATAPVAVEFVGQYRNTAVPTMTTAPGDLTGGAGTAIVATVSTVDAEYDPDDMDTWALGTLTLGAVDDDGEAVTGSVKTALDVFFNGNGTTVEALREVGFQLSVLDPTYSTLDVTFDFATLPGYDPVEVKAAGEAAVASFLHPANRGLAASGDTRTWELDRVVRIGDLHAILNPRVVDGLRYAENVEIEGAAVDFTLPGTIPLTRAGTVTGTAV